MKKENIVEQTKQVQIGPTNEVQGFTSGVFNNQKFANKPIEALCVSNNSSLPGVNVAGKTYFTGKRGTYNNTAVFVTYDGHLLYKPDGSALGKNCEGYAYLTGTNKLPIVLPGVQAVPEFDAEVNQALKLFGINKDRLTNIYYTLDQISGKLKNYAQLGYKSNIFNEVNRLLKWFYPNDLTKLLVAKDNSELDPPLDKQVLTQKYSVDSEISRTLGLKYNNQDVIIYKPNNIGINTTTGSKTRKTDACRTTLIKYLSSTLSYMAGNSELGNDINDLKKELKICTTTGNFENFKDINSNDLLTTSSDDNGDKIQLSKKLSPFGVLNKTLSFGEIKKILQGGKLLSNLGKKYNIQGNPYQLTNGELDVSVNEGHQLKSIIRNKLSVLSENKQKTLISETKIIQSRFNVIQESNKRQTKIVNELIEESFYLANNGLNPKLISEGLFDALKGMFGFGVEGIIQYFKEKLIDLLLSKLGIEGDGWMKGILVKGLADVPLGDFVNGNIFKCNFLVPHIAKAIVEEAISKAGDSKGMTGGFWDVLRNSIVQGIESTEFAQSVERGLSSMICPALSNVGDKLGSMFSTMKDKALA